MGSMPVSSYDSRTTVSKSDSPCSTLPAGNPQVPPSGLSGCRCSNKNLPSYSMKQPAVRNLGFINSILLLCSAFRLFRLISMSTHSCKLAATKSWKINGLKKCNEHTCPKLHILDNPRRQLVESYRLVEHLRQNRYAPHSRTPRSSSP
jgi:hypothetical protein